MNQNDLTFKSELKEILKPLFAAFKKNGLPAAQKDEIIDSFVYVLRGQSLDSVRTAVDEHLKTGKFFPAPSELIKNMGAGSAGKPMTEMSYLPMFTYVTARPDQEEKWGHGDFDQAYFDWCRTYTKDLSYDELSRVNDARARAMKIPFLLAKSMRDLETGQLIQTFSESDEAIILQNNRAHMKSRDQYKGEFDQAVSGMQSRVITDRERFMAVTEARMRGQI